MYPIFFIEWQRIATKRGFGFMVMPPPPSQGDPNDTVAVPFVPTMATQQAGPSFGFADRPQAWSQYLSSIGECASGVASFNLLGAMQFTGAYNTHIRNLASTPVENQLYFYHTDHLGSSGFISRLVTSGAGIGTGRLTQHYQYTPFGENFIHQKGTSHSYHNPYEFNGKEKDLETGYNYYGARHYNASWGVLLSVDPLADERSWLSPYNYCQNNPIMRVDPTGALDGDFISETGKLLGNDGIPDGRVFVINTTEKKFTENGETVPGAGLSSKAAEAATNFVESNSGITAAFEANPGIYDNFTEIVGDAGARQSMIDIVGADDGSGGTSAANNREYNGGIMADGSVVAGTIGPVSSPLQGAQTGAYPAGTVTPFHSHPSGTVTTGGIQLDPFGGNRVIGNTSTTGYRQSPSPGDIQNAGSGIRYTFGMGNGKVYMYNNQGVRATLPAAQFVKPK